MIPPPILTNTRSPSSLILTRPTPATAKEEGVGLLEVLERVTMQVFVRDHCSMIAAPVQCNVDRMPKGSHYERVPLMVNRGKLCPAPAGRPPLLFFGARCTPNARPHLRSLVSGVWVPCRLLARRAECARAREPRLVGPEGPSRVGVGEPGVDQARTQPSQARSSTRLPRRPSRNCRASPLILRGSGMVEHCAGPQPSAQGLCLFARLTLEQSCNRRQ